MKQILIVEQFLAINTISFLLKVFDMVAKDIKPVH